MKNLLKSMALVAVSALAVVACRKNEIQESPVAEDEIFFTLTTADHLSDVEDQGKTYMEYDQESKNYNPFWYKGDKIGVFLTNTFKGNRTKYDVQLENTNDNGQIAVFTGSTTSSEYDASGILYAYYPSSISIKTYENQIVGFNILATQHPTATSFDPAADLLIAKPADYNIVDGDKSKTVTIGDVQFARALAILRVNLYTTDDFKAAQGAAVTKLTVTSEGNTLGGQPRFDITKDNSARIIDYNSTSPSVSAEYTGEAVGAATIGAAKGEGGYVFLVVAPAGSLAGETLVVEGEIEAKGDDEQITTYTFQKTIESLPTSVVLNPGRVLPVAVGLTESNFEEKKPETRLYVEGFDKCKNIPNNGKHYSPSETGVFGRGVTEELEYVYSVENCNIRKNSSGKSDTDPYLYINDVGQYFRIQKLNVPEDMPLTFSAWVKENGTLTVKTKPSDSDDTAWEEFGNIVSTTTGTVYKIASAKTYTAGYYDFELNYSSKQSSQLRVDDIVIDKDNRITLDTPVVTASLDEEMSNKINVTWDAVGNAGSYEVTLQKAGDPGYVVENTANTSISFGGLDYDTEYSVNVKALPADESLYKASAASEWQNITTGAKGVEWKAKTFADLAEGDEVVVVGIKDGVGSRALADDPDGATNPPAVSITFTNDILDSAPADNIIWTVGVNEGNRIFYVDGNKNKWLYCISEYARVGTDAKKEFVWDETHNYMKNIAENIKNPYLGVNFDGENSVWRTAKDPSTSTLIKGETFKFFVKDDPRTALATPVITVTSSSIDKKISVSWAQVTGATSYKVTCTGQTDQTVTLTGCEFTELTPGEYTVTVTAVAQPGTDYKDSPAASKTVTIEDTTPVISYTTPETAEADQTSVEFAYEVTWPREGVELQVTMDEAVDWITELSVDSENKKVSVTLTENTTSEARKAQLKLSYTGAKDKTLYINQNGAVSKVYASLAALVADGKPTTTGTTVTVTLTDDEISKISSGKNLFFMVNGQEIEIYGPSVYPNTWGTVKVGGKISGTITCPWKLYVYEQSGDEVWELTPADWTGLSYTAPLEPCATPVITISDQGSATIECATADATIYYAVSDTEPTEFTQEYTGAVSLTDGQTIWAQAKKEGYNKPSAVTSKTYTAGGGQKDYTYIFTSKRWEATLDGEKADWTCGSEGYQLSSGKGISVTVAKTGANATSDVSYANISKVVVKYCTNASSGEGNIKVKAGLSEEKIFHVAKSSTGGDTLKDAEFTFTPNVTGSVTISVECTTNSVYINSVTITAN